MNSKELKVCALKPTKNKTTELWGLMSAKNWIKSARPVYPSGPIPFRPKESARNTNESRSLKMTRLRGGESTLRRKPISRISDKNSLIKRIRCSTITNTWSKLCTVKCSYPMLLLSRKFKETTGRREDNFQSRSTFNGKSSKNKKCRSLMRGCVKN